MCNCNNTVLHNVAFKLLRDIFNLEKTISTNNLQLKNVLPGECDIQDSVKCCFSNSFLGPARIKNEMGGDNVRMDALEQDSIFAVTKRKLKPSKHLQLGLVTYRNSRNSGCLK